MGSLDFKMKDFALLYLFMRDYMWLQYVYRCSLCHVVCLIHDLLTYWDAQSKRQCPSAQKIAEDVNKMLISFEKWQNVKQKLEDWLKKLDYSHGYFPYESKYLKSLIDLAGILNNGSMGYWALHHLLAYRLNKFISSSTIWRHRPAFYTLAITYYDDNELASHLRNRIIDYIKEILQKHYKEPKHKEFFEDGIKIIGNLDLEIWNPKRISELVKYWIKKARSEPMGFVYGLADIIERLLFRRRIDILSGDKITWSSLKDFFFDIILGLSLRNFLKQESFLEKYTRAMVMFSLMNYGIIQPEISAKDYKLGSLMISHLCLPIDRHNQKFIKFLVKYLLQCEEFIKTTEKEIIEDLKSLLRSRDEEYFYKKEFIRFILFPIVGNLCKTLENMGLKVDPYNFPPTIYLDASYYLAKAHQYPSNLLHKIKENRELLINAYKDGNRLKVFQAIECLI